eukprot:gene14221-biopygen1025
MQPTAGPGRKGAHLRGARSRSDTPGDARPPIRHNPGDARPPIRHNPGDARSPIRHGTPARRTPPRPLGGRTPARGGWAGSREVLEDVLRREFPRKSPWGSP